jgi:protoporphyrinogen oxidase/2-polyprenyl-3-methyl-5-hydroxy-6-metoxy-1,4-benzoquinol methylase
MSSAIGGLSRTVRHKGCRLDIGGHRFFSKVDRVMEWWLEILPLQAQGELEPTISYQGRSRQLDAAREGVDPDAHDRVMLLRDRKSRIYFLGRFFDYPLSLTPETLRRLGVVRAAKITLSYLRSLLSPIREERNLEDFFVNRFGRELYRTFFESYTEKVWGIPCREISSEWGAQRIKGLSIARAVAHFLRRLIPRGDGLFQKDTETSLIERFLYPKYGPGQLWEAVAEAVRGRGGVIHLEHEAVGLEWEPGRIVAAIFENRETGERSRVGGDFFFSTMPVQDLIRAMGDAVPAEVRRVAEGLVYRDFLTVGLLVKELEIREGDSRRISDNWIYVQEHDVKLGRIQIFNNWSPYLVEDDDKTFLGLEYFCSEGDELWSMPDRELADFAIRELASIGFIERESVLDHCVVRERKTYPAYFGSYPQFPTVREFLDGFENLYLIGRNGMHRYNNQDHSMLTAMTAVDNIAAGITGKENIWQVNTELGYHEEREGMQPAAALTSIENLTQAYRVESEAALDSRSQADLYWQRTEVSYPHYPTVRHRRRFILDALRAGGVDASSRIFDYGCGEGGVLAAIQAELDLDPANLAGCDVSEQAIEAARIETRCPNLEVGGLPRTEERYDFVVCSEVIEHTRSYPVVLEWIQEHLAPDGLLVLTTQSGRIHASDVFTGHTQHFEIRELTARMEAIGLRVRLARRWGFPFFSLQKRLTDLSFDRIRDSYLEGGMSPWKRLVFAAAYLSFFAHDWIRLGPQIYLVASKGDRRAAPQR